MRNESAFNVGNPDGLSTLDGLRNESAFNVGIPDGLCTEDSGNLVLLDSRFFENFSLNEVIAISIKSVLAWYQALRATEYCVRIAGIQNSVLHVHGN